MVLMNTFIKWIRTRLWYSGAIWFLNDIIWKISLTGEVIGWWSRYDINYTIWHIVVILKTNLKRNRKKQYFIVYFDIISHNIKLEFLHLKLKLMLLFNYSSHTMCKTSYIILAYCTNFSVFNENIGNINF